MFSVDHLLVFANWVFKVSGRDERYQNFDVDAISICKASIYQYITIFITAWTFSLNLCKRIKYTAFRFKFLCFGDLNLPLLLKTATHWTLLLPWLTSNPEKNLFAIYIFFNYSKCTILKVKTIKITILNKLLERY